jgi:hypothetical protein
LAFQAYNLFHTFLARNIKSPLCRVQTECFWAQLIAARIYTDAGRCLTRVPPERHFSSTASFHALTKATGEIFSLESRANEKISLTAYLDTKPSQEPT